MEHAFTDPAAKMCLKSFTDFTKYFVSEEFHNSVAYNNVLDRCFNETLDTTVSAMLSRVLAGKGNSTDIGTMKRLGWWSENKNRVISDLLCSTLMCRVEPDQSKNQIMLEKVNDPQENIETIIVTGLESMHPTDFTCIQDPSNVKVEDGISVSWALGVKSAIKNIYYHFQPRANAGRVDHYFNGHTSGVIETMLNGVLYKKGSQSFFEHLSRFNPKKYAWKSWALFNFDMEAPSQRAAVNQPVPLLKDILEYSTDEQLSRIYTFVHVDNALYQGDQIIKAPAVNSLPSSFSFPYIPLRKRKPYERKIYRQYSASRITHVVSFGRR
jgi:hypothetical protein